MKSFPIAACLLYLSVLSCFAQDNEQALSAILLKLEEHSNVRFSYIDEIISGKTIDSSIELDSELAALVELLEKQTLLKFERVNDQYYIIRPFKETDTVSICGKVINADSKPLEGVLIIDHESGNGVITGKDGSFRLENVPYSAVYTLRYLGFNSRQFNPGDLFGTKCPEIKMIEAVGLMEELTVSDYLRIGIIKENNEVKIFPQELKILPGLTEPDILQSIQQVPGIMSPYETASGIHVRGGSPDQNLVLWNGIKTYNQGHLFGMLSAFNPYITDEVTFIKKGTSAEYGDRISSVIDIKTKNTIPDQLSGGAGFNMIYGDAYINIPIIEDKLSILASSRRSYTDLLETFTYRRFSERVYQNTKISESSDDQQANHRFFFHDFTSSINFQPTKNHHLEVNTLYTKNALNFSTRAENSSETYNDILNTENEGYNLRWNTKINDRLSFNISGNYAKYLLSYEFRRLINDTTDLSSKKNLVSDLGTQLNLSYQFSNNHQLKWGYHYASNSIQYAFESKTPNYQLVLDKDAGQINTHALYTTYGFRNNEGTSVDAGIRASHYSELNRTYFEPRVYVAQALTPAIEINASGEYRTQTASQIQESVVSDLSLENQVWTLASDRFPVIESYQVTLGSIYKHDDWYFDIEGYHKRISGVTTLTFGFLNPVGNEFSRGNSYILGGDVFLKKQFERYKSWLGYSYIHTENEFFDLNNGDPFPGNWNIEHTLRWSHFYDINGWQFSLGWLWHTGKSYTEVQESSTTSGPVAIQFDRINGNNLPVYHRLDFSMVYNFQFKQNDCVNYRIGISVLNLYNRKNQLNREFRTTPSLENELIETNVYSLGITPNLMFRVFW